jgi:hypothetical protein
VVIAFVISGLQLDLSVPLDGGMALQVLEEHTISLIIFFKHDFTCISLRRR